jgi:hypothetical protein
MIFLKTGGFPRKLNIFFEKANNHDAVNHHLLCTLNNE